METEAMETEIQLALLPKSWPQYRDTLVQRKDAVWVRILAKNKSPIQTELFKNA